MTEFFNKKEQTQTRKKLRAQTHSITCEEKIWQKIRNKQLGCRFRRQFGIGQYVVDFYCPRLRLAVEIDGATHVTTEEINKDYKRQRYIESLQIKVKRYFNDDIKNNLPAVLADLKEECDRLNLGKPLPVPPLRKGREKF